jgi:hypothetical protein
MNLQELINNVNLRNLVFGLIVVVVILCVWNCYLTNKLQIVEGMTGDNNPVSPLNLTAIRKLGNITQKIVNSEDLFIPSDLSIQGNLNVTGNTTLKNITINEPTDDARHYIRQPSYYRKLGMGIYNRFKDAGTIRVVEPARHKFVVLKITVPWSDKSGGPILQECKNSVGTIFMRSGYQDDTAWGPWGQHRAFFNIVKYITVESGPYVWMTFRQLVLRNSGNKNLLKGKTVSISNKGGEYKTGSTINAEPYSIDAVWASHKGVDGDIGGGDHQGWHGGNSNQLSYRVDLGNDVTSISDLKDIIIFNRYVDQANNRLSKATVRLHDLNMNIIREYKLPGFSNEYGVTITLSNAHIRKFPYAHHDERLGGYTSANFSDGSLTLS